MQDIDRFESHHLRDGNGILGILKTSILTEE